MQKVDEEQKSHREKIKEMPKEQKTTTVIPKLIHRQYQTSSSNTKSYGTCLIPDHVSQFLYI